MCREILLPTRKWQLIACVNLNYWALTGHLMQPIHTLFPHHVKPISHSPMYWVEPNVTSWLPKQQWRQWLEWTPSPTSTVIFQLLSYQVIFIPIGKSSLQMRMKFSLPLALDMSFDSVVQTTSSYQIFLMRGENSPSGWKQFKHDIGDRESLPCGHPNTRYLDSTLEERQ